MQITTVQYYRLSWLFPIFFPVAALITDSLLRSLGLVLPDAIGMAISISFSAVFMFLIPYAVLVGVYLYVLHNRSQKVYVVAILFSPVLMVLSVSLFLVVAGSGAHDILDMALFYARYCLAVGYSYVALIFALLWLLRRTHIVTEA